MPRPPSRSPRAPAGTHDGAAARPSAGRRAAQTPARQTADEGAALSASKRVYQVLRQRILDLEMAPGDRIIELDIAAEHGLSRTPVHEAVQRLADEGLVEIRQRVGTFVARIPIDGLEEAMLVRTALEVAVVERAAAKIQPAQLAQLVDILAQQAQATERRDMPSFHRTDEAFHALLADIAGFPGIWRTIQQSKTQVDRFRRLTLPLEGRMPEVMAEHHAVLRALQAGQPAQAAAAMREHLDQVLPIIEITRAFRPDYFVTQHTTERRSD